MSEKKVKAALDVRRLSTDGPSYLETKVSNINYTLQSLGAMPALFKKLILYPMAFIIQESLKRKENASMSSMMNASAIKMIESEIKDFVGLARKNVGKVNIEEKDSGTIMKTYTGGVEKLLLKAVDEFKAMFDDENLLIVSEKSLNAYLVPYVEMYETEVAPVSVTVAVEDDNNIEEEDNEVEKKEEDNDNNDEDDEDDEDDGDIEDYDAD